MPETQKQKPEAQAQGLKFWHILLGILILIIATWAVYYMQAKANFQQAKQKIRDAGYPITYAELNDWYKLPEGAQNAADSILAALSHHTEWDDENVRSLPVIGDRNLAFDEPYDQDMLELAERYVEENQEMIDLLHKAAKIKHARYPVKIINAFVFDYDYLGDIKRAIQTLTIAAHVHAENDQPEKAIDTLQTMTAISHSLSNVPILIPQLVRIGCDALTTATTERVISRCDLSDTQLQRIATMIKIMQTNSMVPGFVGERCFMISAIEDGILKEYDFGDFWRDAALVAARVTGLVYNDMVIRLDVLTDTINASSLSLAEQIKSVKSIQKKIESLDPIHLFARMAMPAMTRFIKMDHRHATILTVAQTAIAVQRWRLKNGKLPENLNQLVPDYLEQPTIDPYDGNPLRYIISDEAFIVYSIGENKIDEGGLKEKMKDITFEIKQKPK